MSKSHRKEMYERNPEPVEDQSDSPISDSESESEEDENAALVTAETEAEVLRTVALLRSRDPRIYQKEVDFYNDEHLENAEKKWISAHETKDAKNSLTLKKMYQQQLIDGNAEGFSEIDSFNNAESESLNDFSAKDEFKRAFSGLDEEDDLLVLKDKNIETLHKEDLEYKEFLYQSLSSDKATSQTAHDWFSLKDNMDENEKFLINFVLNRGWIDDPQSKKSSATNERTEIEEDEQELDKMEAFEQQHNFRFEAGTEATVIPTYPREIKDSVRSTSERRKRQREAKKLRLQQEKDALAEELKREKNALKKSRKMKELDEELDREMEEQIYKKDFEDVIEGMPTRFKCFSVPKT